MSKTGRPAKEKRFPEKTAINKLEGILFEHKRVMPDLKSGDTGPNIDGYLKLIDTEGVQEGVLEVQVKTLNKSHIRTNISYSFKNDKFLSYCKKIQDLPVLFIGVDIRKDRAYWREITPDYVESLNGKRAINLPWKNIIDKNHRVYYENWWKISDERREVLNTYFESKRKNELNDQRRKPSIKKGKISSQDINQAKERLQKIFIDPELKYKSYYPFIDLLEPFYLDKKGVEKREKLRTLFSITEKEENVFLKRMKKNGLIKVVGDLCIIKDQQKADELLNEIINKGAIDLEFILKLF